MREASGWLAANPAPDLLLLDIQLADGLSLELFAGGIEGLLRSFAAPAAPAYRRRILGRKGAQWSALAIDDIACFVSVDKLAFALACDGARHLVDGTLADIERELDPARFFRANRQTLLNVDAVAGFRAAGKGRLVAALNTDGDDVEISPERVQAFREWLAR